MRPIYLVLKIVLNYSLSLYHRNYIRINAPKTIFTRSIFASNHASSFFDPLIIAVRQYPIVHFMTRADIYNGYLKVVFWLAQMIPIYRAQDGADAVKKNEEVFNTCYKELKKGKGLILFAEGFTDDVFIRRLKPIKKGSLRIGFYVCERLNWSKKIYIQPTGINYTDPTKFRSSVLISYGEKICLNDYKEDYIANPARTLVNLTKRVEKGMQEQITHVENMDWAPFHENIMRLTRKGMNNECYDRSLSLKNRWKYSRELALWMNGQEESDEKIIALKEKTELYFNQLKKEKVEENYVYEFSKKKRLSFVLNYFVIIAGFPLFLIGFIHGAPSYFWFKSFVEKSFKRAVFWSSVKMVGGLFIAGIYNLIFLFLFHGFIYPSWWLAIAYYFIVPGISFLAMHAWLKNLKEIKSKKSCLSKDFESLVNKRTELLKEIHEVVPVA